VKGETKAMRERQVADVPMESVGIWLSHNIGFDMSTLPPRFSIRELNDRIIAANESPVSIAGLLIEQYGQDGKIRHDEFMRYGCMRPPATPRPGPAQRARWPTRDVQSDR
jgi:hypothetical protein